MIELDDIIDTLEGWSCEASDDDITKELCTKHDLVDWQAREFIQGWKLAHNEYMNCDIEKFMTGYITGCAIRRYGYSEQVGFFVGVQDRK